MALLPATRQRLSAEMKSMIDSHPSLAASLEDFEHDDARSRASHSPMFGIPSQHSGFRSDHSESEADSEPPAPWSPPAWRKESSGWYQRSRFAAYGRSESRSHSPQHERPSSRRDLDDPDLTLPVNIPLPASPEKMTPRSTVDREMEEPEGDTTQLASPPPTQQLESRETSMAPEVPQNYIRFAVRAEVQHRTEPIEAVVTFVRQKFDMVTRSWSTTIISVLVGFVAITMLRSLFTPPEMGPSPDLIQAAGFVNGFEPLMVYSEHGPAQINELQDTSSAVWDLGEGVRHTNMTSAPLIVGQLDDLSDKIKTLAVELTRFFAHVNGDVDGILLVMDWAKRELAKARNPQMGSISTAFTNVHSALCKVGLFESGGTPTSIGRVVMEVFGQTTPQRQKAALQKTFNGLLDVLEDSIGSELKFSMQIFALFESIERQFTNLARTVQREQDSQNLEEAELLSTLWVRLMGPKATTLRKFERNRSLLSGLKAQTMRSKSALRDHNNRLAMLKEGLEVIRQRIVHPMVRGVNSTLSIEEQIAGLAKTQQHLEELRERQRAKSMEALMVAGQGRGRLMADGPMEIDSER